LIAISLSLISSYIASITRSIPQLASSIAAFLLH